MNERLFVLRQYAEWAWHFFGLQFLLNPLFMVYLINAYNEFFGSTYH